MKLTPFYLPLIALILVGCTSEADDPKTEEDNAPVVVITDPVTEPTPTTPVPVPVPPVVTPVPPTVVVPPLGPIDNGVDIVILLGQSNMVGRSGDNLSEDFENGADEPNSRILQLNVTTNEGVDVAGTVQPYIEDVVINDDPIIVARNELHSPTIDGIKRGDANVGLGLSFGKEYIKNSDNTVVLVPAAMSSSSFCGTGEFPVGHWNVSGEENDWLLSRAVVRTDRAIAETGGNVTAILWHQGESENTVECANKYRTNLSLMVDELRSLYGDVPFVVGTMSRGEGYAVYGGAKLIVDTAHREVSTYVPQSGVAVFDDLTPSNGYPCGVRGDCIHFGAEALREMGRRYYDVYSNLLETGS